MNTAEAVAFTLEAQDITKYRLSQDMGCAPILVDKWLTGTQMGKQYRFIFESNYGIKINETMDASSRNS